MKKGTRILVIAAVVILVATYIMNGAEKETAWLYLFALGLVLLPVVSDYLKQKKEKDQ